MRVAVALQPLDDASLLIVAQFVDLYALHLGQPRKALEPVLALCQLRLRRDAAGAMMVGDFADDMQAGRAAGVLTCLITNGAAPRFEAELHFAWPADLLAGFEAAWAAGK